MSYIKVVWFEGCVEFNVGVLSFWLTKGEKDEKERKRRNKRIMKFKEKMRKMNGIWTFNSKSLQCNDSKKKFTE